MSRESNRSGRRVMAAALALCVLGGNAAGGRASAGVASTEVASAGVASAGFASANSGLQGQVLLGYQAWFDCPEQGGSWAHWALQENAAPTPATLRVDLYPDLSEFRDEDLCPGEGFSIGGRPARFFASRNAAVIDAHFRWMKEYGLDGIMLQRFVGRIAGKRAGGDVALRRILASAREHGRSIFIEYDLTGGREETAGSVIMEDWKYLVDTLQVTSHPGYVIERGLPVVSVWGPGFNDRPPVSPSASLAFVRWFNRDAPQAYRAFYMGGVPEGWRGLTGASRTDPAWRDVYDAMDALQPWTVGRFSDSAGADAFRRNFLAPDMAEAKARGKLYMPVVFPGFSWKNLKGGAANQIPRRGGKFIWRQAYNAKAAGAAMLKIAMFDEIDEGTAMFKVVSRRNQAPDQGFWLALDADGYALPSDWYLRVAGEITSLFHGTRPLVPSLPLDPSNPAVAIRGRPSVWQWPARGYLQGSTSSHDLSGRELKSKAAGAVLIHRSDPIPFPQRVYK